MRGFFLAALGALTIAGCAPAPRQIVSQAVPERPATLLKKLALDVPSDVANLPALTPYGEASAPVGGAAPAFVLQAQTTDDGARALDCLTAAIYYEARSEPLDGQRAVAQVVLNRVRDRAFPASICGVVYQGSARRTGCQFSFTCDGSMLRPRDPGAWMRSGAIAAAALAGQVYAPVGSATHFHTTAINPWWAPSLTRLQTVGSHIFYRWPNMMERALAFRQSYSGFEPVAATPAQAIAEAGVAVHRGDAASETVAGVTIHRGFAAAIAEANATAPVAAAAAVATAAATLPAAVPVAVAAAEPPARLGPALVSGVRIHRGVSAPDGS